MSGRGRRLLREVPHRERCREGASRVYHPGHAARVHEPLRQQRHLFDGRRQEVSSKSIFYYQTHRLSRSLCVCAFNVDFHSQISKCLK